MVEIAYVLIEQDDVIKVIVVKQRSFACGSDEAKKEKKKIWKYLILLEEKVIKLFVKIGKILAKTMNFMMDLN